MAALSLHHAIFNKEKYSDVPLRSATSFLRSEPERDRSPTNQLSASPAYQDLIQRQPIHPDGPTSGWDLGLNLFGDPITPAEHKGLEDYQTKMKLRRLHVISVTLEFLFGVWGVYTTVRYCLASADGLDDTRRVCAFVLSVLSAFSVVLVIISIMMPLFPQRRPHIWRYTRLLIRACYLLLLCAGAVMNFVLVLVWHPSQLCDWDIDISWYISAANTSSPCHAVSFSIWVTAAAIRLVVTLAFVLSLVSTLCSYYRIRHPCSFSPKCSSFPTSDPGDISPVSVSSPRQLSKSIFRLMHSEDSSRTLNQSNTTLPKSNSISTLAPSTSCTGHSRSHSTPPKDISPPRISSPTSRSASTHTTNYATETPSQTQPVNAVTPSPSTPHLLRRTSRLSITQVTPDAMLPVCSDGTNCPTVTRDSSEIRSSASSKPSRRGTGAHLDVKKTSLPWESAHARHASQQSDGPGSFPSTHDDGESIKENDMADDDLMYSYGYGASGATYPYLDMYNPQWPGRCPDRPSSCENDDARAISQGYRRAIPDGPELGEVSSEPRSSLSTEEDEESSSGEEEEYVPMMGGFVRRMATIESLGSKEAAGTLSATGSVAHHSMRSRTPASQFSSVRFAEQRSSCGSSSGVHSSRDGSHTTGYLSFSSGGTTGMRVNERGELLPGPNANGSAAGSPYDRQFYTASGNSFPRTNDEERW